MATSALFGLTGLFVVDRLLAFGLGDAPFTTWEAVTSVVLAALFVALTLSVRQGNNLMRVITTLLLVVGVFRALDPITQSHPLLIRAVALVELVLEVGIVVLLWIGPANRYFLPPRSGR
ncbi:hypothetical protein [Sphaerisporangium corydalis]|uniref:DUF4345 domain-containing protein n=1 Tax=Sphaerisporangium corydalis TaxID=1441875 RepID=A0ABV9EHM1_9ACTN|nr:hypothetical protein [Sphaerisporangium corydalis]